MPTIARIGTRPELSRSSRSGPLTGSALSFHFERLELPEIVLICPTRHRDARGFFSETYRRSAFVEAGIDATFVQDNVARSAEGVLRGVHFQAPPAAQGKLVGVARGRIFDVAVDLRAGGPTYGNWEGRTLDDESGELLWIPPGFGHGYVTLGDGADVFYRVTAEYDPGLDGGVRWDTLGIDWPVADPILSDRDRALPPFQELRSPFVA